MAAPSATWTVRRVFGTYRNRLSLAMEPGTWEATATGRIVNTLGDGSKQIFRAGKIASGTLSTTDGSPSIDIDLPVTDDPDNSPQGGQITLTITLSAGGVETYTLSPLESWSAAGTDLATLLDPSVVPSAPAYALVGVPGGVAALDSDGDVVDATGDKVIAGGALYGVSTWNAATSHYEPLRDPDAVDWTYKAPAGVATPNDSNGGLGRQDGDLLRVKPSA